MMQQSGQGLEDQLQALLAFARSRGGPAGSGGANRSGQGPAADPNVQRQPMATDATRRLGPMRERGWMFCHRCKQWGLHIRAECKWSLNQIKAAGRADSKTPPTSTPSDQQYPNC